MMRKTWLLIFIFTGLAALWFSQSAIRQLWFFYQLKLSVPATVQEWTIEEVTPDRFALSASYFYEFQEKSYSGKCVFQEPIYQNRYSAEADKILWEKLSWSAWMNPKQPKISSLQRLFPWKGTVYAIVTLGIFGYFFTLRRLNQRRALEDGPIVNDTTLSSL